MKQLHLCDNCRLCNKHWLDDDDAKEFTFWKCLLTGDLISNKYCYCDSWKSKGR